MRVWRWFLPPAALLAFAVVRGSASPAQAEDAVHIKSHVSYEVRPGQEPVRVNWDVTFENNDPATTASGEGDTVFFYENLTIPVLRGASAVSATASSGEPLTVTLGEPGPSPTVSAYVSFHQVVFYGETYSFKLSYELADVRAPSLLVTPSYVYLPVIAGGDESTVTVSSPGASGWSVSLQPAECAQSGNTFTCSGADASFLAAILEVSQPNANASFAFDVPVGAKKVNVTMSYFQGEAGAAQHLKELVSAGLPVIERLYGFPYPGPGSVRVAQGAQRAVRGYEGLTSCGQLDTCSVTVSPAADDITVLHELAHFWSGIYGKRWLSEGFAQLIAEEAAQALPPGLVQNPAAQKEPAAVDLRLDGWGNVSSLIGANESELGVERAGYDRSLKFLYLLQSEVGTGTLAQVNASLAESGAPADSKRYLDLVEELAGKRVDQLFAEWVFPPSMEPALAARRQTRDRLEALERQATERHLYPSVPEAIRGDVEAWEFDRALAALNDAEATLAGFQEIKQRLSQLMLDVDAQGLPLPRSIIEAIKNWDFQKANQMFVEANSAIEAYVKARERTESSRNFWEGLGLTGADPAKDVSQASRAFAKGDFKAALDHANEASRKVDGASLMTVRKLLVLALVFGLSVGGVGVAVWLSRRQEEELAPR
jgi:hypothetical protein